jgi:hypothetical protein
MSTKFKLNLHQFYNQQTYFLQEVTFARLQIPMNKKQIVVEYMISKPLHMHTKFVTFDKIVLQFHPMCLNELMPSF